MLNLMKYANLFCQLTFPVKHVGHVQKIVFTTVIELQLRDKFLLFK